MAKISALKFKLTQCRKCLVPATVKMDGKMRTINRVDFSICEGCLDLSRCTAKISISAHKQLGLY